MIARTTFWGSLGGPRLDACRISARDGRARPDAPAPRAQGGADPLRRAGRVGAQRGGSHSQAARERPRARLPGREPRDSGRVRRLDGSHRRDRRRAGGRESARRPHPVPARGQGRGPAPCGARDVERRPRVHRREQRVEAGRAARARQQSRRRGGRLRLRAAPPREPGRREHGGRVLAVRDVGARAGVRPPARSPRATAPSTR